MVRPGRPALTARWVAAQRLRLHDDRPSSPQGDVEFERRLYAGLHRGLALPGLQPTGMAVRTGFLDAEVLSALADGVDQFVIVGAGYDGRAWRFQQPAVDWFEVDHPATQPDKRLRVTRAHGDQRHVRFVPVDLMTDDISDALRHAGYDAHRPGLFICEGLFSYLPNSTGRDLCARLATLASNGSVLAASFLVVPKSGRQPLQALADSVLAAIGERRLGSYPPGVAEDMLTATGWRPNRLHRTDRSKSSGSQLLLIAASR